MLNITGDILNWLAAGVLAPLMFLPLAGMASGQRAASTAIWLGGVTALVAIGAAVAALTPVLRATPTSAQLITFGGLTIATAIAVFLVGGARNAASKLAPIAETVVRQTGRAVIWLLLAMALTQFGVVILRYVFGVNFIFMQEAVTYMHGGVFMLAAGYALVTNDHVRVDIFYREAPQRRKAQIDLLGAYFFLFPVCLLLLWTASPYVAQSWATFEGSTETSGIQGFFLLKSLIPAFATLLALAGFSVAAKAAGAFQERG